MVRPGEPSSSTWLALRFRLIISFFVFGVQSRVSKKGESRSMWNPVEVGCFSGVTGVGWGEVVVEEYELRE